MPESAGPAPMRWVGIDEAGYGPNLGPLVLTAVVAEGPEDREPDVWADLAATVARAGGPADRLWVDDSKRVYRGGLGRDRLEAACLASLIAAGLSVPASLGGLMQAVGAGTLAEVELTPWLDPGGDPAWPGPGLVAHWKRWEDRPPLAGAAWRIVGVRSVVVGPSRFNRALEATGSKASVHFGAFAELLAAVWLSAAEGVATRARSDKHGGRHFYAEPLRAAFPTARIDPGPEGPALSQYALSLSGHRLDLSLQPRAEAADGLVALASLISKTLRELWMEAFNAYWRTLRPGLRPTAGYPTDAARFRSEVAPVALARGLTLETWWRFK